jgi:hypothetical protein
MKLKILASIRLLEIRFQRMAHIQEIVNPLIAIIEVIILWLRRFLKRPTRISAMIVAN